MIPSRWAQIGLLLVTACGPTSTPESAPAPAPGSGARRGQEALVPPGYGTLRQDEFTVSLRSGALLVKATPLDEIVIRLSAPDTYTRLHSLAESRRADAERTGGADVELFLVSFFSYEPDVTYQPEDLQLSHQGRLLRSFAIYPLTPNWGRQRLQQQETQSALYAFQGPVDYDLGLVVRYGIQQSDAWSRIIPVLEVERAKVRARAG